MDLPGYVGNAVIYDSRGRRIKNLVQNELLGLEGQFNWDGIMEDGGKAPIGLYILFFEAFHQDGKVVSKKLSFGIAIKTGK
jgi:flagellar hook assembly protein FlgD